MVGVFLYFLFGKIHWSWHCQTVFSDSFLFGRSPKKKLFILHTYIHLGFYFLCFSFSETLINKEIIQASYTCSVSAFKKTEIKHSLTVRGNYWDNGLKMTIARVPQFWWNYCWLWCWRWHKYNKSLKLLSPRWCVTDQSNDDENDGETFGFADFDDIRWWPLFWDGVGNDDDDSDECDDMENITTVTCEWRIADLWYQLGLRWKP